jgi:hypothetical protein
MATPAKIREKISDFDPAELLSSHEQHESKISDLTDRVSKLEKHFATPQAAAEFIEDCAKDSRNFDGVFAKMFVRFLDESTEVREAIQKRMNEADRNFFFKTFRRTWFAIYSILLIVGTVLVKALVQWLLSFLQHGQTPPH